MVTSVCIKDNSNNVDKETMLEQLNTNELDVSKLLKVVHFLECNNFSDKELHSNRITFLSEAIEESGIAQHLAPTITQLIVALIFPFNSRVS